MKETGIPVVRKEQGTGKNAGATVYGIVILPDQNEAEKFANALGSNQKESSVSAK